MSGIKILNSYKVFDLSDMLSVILIMILFLIIAAIFYINDNKTVSYSVALVAIIGIIVASIGFRFSDMRHEVLIDDSVPFVEFYESYEVADKRGEIFVIEEKK